MSNNQSTMNIKRAKVKRMKMCQYAEHETVD